MTQTKHYYGIVALTMVFWFVISFITNIIGPLIPDIIDNFKLSQLALAGFIPTSFFLAFAVISIPAGIMVYKWGQKTVLALGFLLPLIGSCIFALHPTFPVLLVSSFTIGLGMAMLQTVLKPLTRVAGGEENFAFFSVMSQLIFGAASFVSPLVYSSLVSKLSSGEQLTGISGVLQKLTPADLPWASLYWLFTAILIVMVLVTLIARFPKMTVAEEDKSGGISAYKELLKNKYVYLFFLGIICYTAVESGVANWVSKFLMDYHGFDPTKEGASTIGLFWGLMSVGCVLGLVVLKLWDSRKVLKVICAMALISLILALFGSAKMALIFFPAFGFSISIMFSIIFSLALNSVSIHHVSFAGILCTGIVGGALGPLVVGSLADIVGLRYGMLVLSLAIAYIFSVAIWARPLVENKHKFGKK